MSIVEKIKKLTTFAEIAEGRQKGLLEDIMDQELTWDNYENASLGKDIVPIITFREYPDTFYFGGMAFRDIIKELNEKDLDELRKKGVKIVLSKHEVKSDKRKTFTRVDVVE